jgi:hypothetical protein
MTILGLLVVLTSLADTTTAQGFDPGTQSAGTHRLVVLRVHDEADRTVVVSVVVGRAATISRPGVPMLRIGTTVSPDGLLNLTGSLMPTGGDATSTAIESAMTAPIALGRTARLQLGEYAVDIAWIDDKTVENSAGTSGDEVSECCVVCEGIKTCACRVQAPCGGCCDEQCGGCGQTDGQAPCSGAAILK